MCRLVSTILVALTGLLTAVPVVFAQAEPPPKPWTIAASAGLALTSGNTDTSTVNVAYDLVYDPRAKNSIKSDGLMIRGKTEGELSADRLGLNIRDEYRINGSAYVFGKNQYLRDRFKDIDYLYAPSAGLGLKLLDTTGTKLETDVGVGGVWEKNSGASVRSSGAVTVGEKLTQALTATTTLTQAFSGLWKTQDFQDSLLTLGVGVAAAMSTHTQLKVELLDTFKNKPPTAAVEKNDVAILIAVVFKM